MNTKARVAKAYRKLIAYDSYLFENDVNERAITHHFAIYLGNEFPDYHVDCEYNRIPGIETAAKRLPQINQCINTNDTDAKTVYPDIIVHIRGTNDKNLVVIEAKKTNRDDKYDTDKLISYKTCFNYEHAYLVHFPVKCDFKELDTSFISDMIQEIRV